MAPTPFGKLSDFTPKVNEWLLLSGRVTIDGCKQHDKTRLCKAGNSNPIAVTNGSHPPSATHWLKARLVHNLTDCLCMAKDDYRFQVRRTWLLTLTIITQRGCAVFDWLNKRGTSQSHTQANTRPAQGGAKQQSYCSRCLRLLLWRNNTNHSLGPGALIVTASKETKAEQKQTSWVQWTHWLWPLRALLL